MMTTVPAGHDVDDCDAEHPGVETASSETASSPRDGLSDQLEAGGVRGAGLGPVVDQGQRPVLGDPAAGALVPAVDRRFAPRQADACLRAWQRRWRHAEALGHGTGVEAAIPYGHDHIGRTYLQGAGKVDRIDAAKSVALGQPARGPLHRWSELHRPHRRPQDPPSVARTTPGCVHPGRGCGPPRPAKRTPPGRPDGWRRRRRSRPIAQRRCRCQTPLPAASPGRWHRNRRLPPISAAARSPIPRPDGGPAAAVVQPRRAGHREQVWR